MSYLPYPTPIMAYVLFPYPPVTEGGDLCSKVADDRVLVRVRLYCRSIPP